MDTRQDTAAKTSLQHLEMVENERQPSTTKNQVVEEVTSAYKITRKTILAIMALYFAFATQNAQMITILTLGHQIAAVGGVQAETWVPNAATLSLSITQISLGSISDHFGKRNFILVGLILGIVAGLVSSRANGIGQLIAGQSIAGVAGSLVLLCLPALQEVVPNKIRPLVAGWSQISVWFLNSTVMVADSLCVKYNVTGPNNGWRWSYYFPAICCAVSFPLVFFAYKPPAARLRCGKTARQVLSELDYVGIFLGMAGVMFLLLGLNWGGTSYSWGSAHVVSTLVVGICLLLAFGLHEWKATSVGILQHRLFITRNFAMILAVNFVDGIIFQGTAAYLPQEVAALFSSDPVFQTTPLLVASAGVMIGSALGGYLFFKMRRYRIVLCTSLLSIALAVGLAALISPSRRYWIWVCPAMWSLGLGVTTSLPYALISLSVPDDLIGTAVTIATTLRNIGGTIGVTIYSSVYSNKMGEYVQSLVIPAATTAGVPVKSITALIELLSAGASAQEVESRIGISKAVYTQLDSTWKDAVSQSYQYVYFTILPFCLTTAILVYFLVPVADRMNNHVESSLENTSGKVLKHDLETDDV